MDRRLYVHVGAPKSGTTYLQSRLLANRRALQQHGLTYPLGPGRDPRVHYRAALDVVGRDHGLDGRVVEGAWPRLLRLVRRCRGDVVLGHEVLSSADAEQAERVLADLAATGSEVHVVMTARDLARELAGGWQEMVKFGSRRSFAAYLERARDGRLDFQRSFDPTRVLSNWGADLPSSRRHLVTAPPQGPADVLWQRYLQALGADASWAPAPAAQANASIGVPQARLLRRLNKRLGAETRRGGAYASLVEDVLVPALADRDAPRISLGPDHHDWVARRTEDWVRWLTDSGVTVHGDLEDLRPAPPDPDRLDPDGRMPDLVATAALDAVEALLDELRTRPRPLTSRVRSAVGRLRR